MLTRHQATQARQTARATASARGHRLSRFLTIVKDHTWYAGCTICGEEITVIIRPNDTEPTYQGNVMTVNCKWPNGVYPK
jgi:hypothetical protein